MSNTAISGPLYVTSISKEGTIMLGGIFRMKDQQGFPLDCSIDECKIRGLSVDFCELLCDAWLNDCLKFDSVVKELGMLGESHEREWNIAGAMWLASNPEAMKRTNPVDEFCKFILDLKRNGSPESTLKLRTHPAN